MAVGNLLKELAAGCYRWLLVGCDGALHGVYAAEVGIAQAGHTAIDLHDMLLNRAVFQCNTGDELHRGTSLDFLLTTVLFLIHCRIGDLYDAKLIKIRHLSMLRKDCLTY